MTEEKRIERDTQRVMHVEPDKIRETLIKSLSERIKELRDGETNFYISDRLNDTGFMQTFHDSLFTYRNGFVLCERLYQPHTVQFQEKEVPEYSEADAKLYREMIQYTQSLPDMSEINEEEAEAINKKIYQYHEALSQKERKMIVKQVPFYETPYGEGRKLLLAPLKDQSDQFVENFSIVTADFVISYFQTMLMLPGDTGFMLRSIEAKAYTDVIVNIMP